MGCEFNCEYNCVHTGGDDIGLRKIHNELNQLSLYGQVTLFQ
jgi:hypothetical protein